MKIWPIPFVLGVLAIIAGNVSFILSVNEGFVETCFPYFEGCTSISKTGRQGLSFIVFKLIILPVMTLLSIYWLLSYNLIKNSIEVHKLTLKIMITSGVIGSIFGIIYASFLGSEGNIYQLLRRFGIYFFFLGTYLSQVLEVYLLFRSKKNHNSIYLKIMKFLSYLIGLVNVFSIPIYGLIEEDDWLENVLEWNITLLIFIYFILVSLFWKEKNYLFIFKSNYLDKGNP